MKSSRRCALSMILLELRQPLLKFREALFASQRHTSTNTLKPAAARGCQRNPADTVVEQFLHKRNAGKPGISDREVKSVGQGFIFIQVVDEGKPVVREKLFHDPGPVSIFFDRFDKIVLAVVDCLEQSGEAVLGTVGTPWLTGAFQT